MCYNQLAQNSAVRCPESRQQGWKLNHLHDSDGQWQDSRLGETQLGYSLKRPKGSDDRVDGTPDLDSGKKQLNQPGQPSELRVDAQCFHSWKGSADSSEDTLVRCPTK